jgi:hypothetical protein
MLLAVANVCPKMLASLILFKCHWIYLSSNMHFLFFGPQLLITGRHKNSTCIQQIKENHEENHLAVISAGWFQNWGFKQDSSNLICSIKYVFLIDILNLISHHTTIICILHFYNMIVFKKFFHFFLRSRRNQYLPDDEWEFAYFW